MNGVATCAMFVASRPLCATFFLNIAHLWFSIFFEPIYRVGSYILPRLPKTRAAIIRHVARDSSLIFVARYIVGPLSWLCWSARYRRVLRARTGPNSLTTWLELRGTPRAPPPVLIIYIHGGGFGSHTATEFAFAGEVLPRLAAKGVAARVLALDYSLAPQASRAKQQAQLMAAYQQATGSFALDRVVLAGDSAGGHHALALFLELLDFGPRFPDALIAISPWLNLAPLSERPGDYMPPKLVKKFIAAAAHSESFLWPPTNFLSRLADGQHCRHCPPTLVAVGGAELFRDEGRALAGALQESPACDDCVLVEVPKGVHDTFFLPFFDATPGAAALGLDGIAAFVLAQCE